MKLIVILAGLTGAVSTLFAQDQSRPTYDAVVKGLTCKQSGVSTAQLDCDYRVGKSLHFVIAGIGEPDAAFTVLRAAGYDGDFYATFGVQHGCVIVKRGAASLRPALPDFAFVSPATGKVYESWEECGRTTKRLTQ